MSTNTQVEKVKPKIIKALKNTVNDEKPEELVEVIYEEIYFSKKRLKEELRKVKLKRNLMN